MKLGTKDTIWAAPKSWASLITSEDIPGNVVYTERPVKLADGVAIIDVQGVLLRDEDGLAEFFGGASTVRISRQIAEALADESVKSILLYINSPGGQVNGTAELADQIYAARQVKPVTAYISGDGYSAAYWLASQAGKIYMHSAAGAGSIGVCYPVETENYTTWLVSDVSPNKHPEVAGEASRAQMQTMLDDLGSIFVDAVARGRGITRDEVLSRFGGGDIFIALKAVDRGLADEVGSFESALAFAKGGEPAGAAQDAETGKEDADEGAQAIIQKTKHEVKMSQARHSSAEMIDTADMTVERIKEYWPDLYDQIVNDAQDSETNRQTELDAMTPANEEEKQAIAAARKDRKITAQKLAFDLRIAAQAREQAKINAIAAARAEDSAGVVIPVTPENTPKTAEQQHNEKVKAAMLKKANKAGK